MPIRSEWSLDYEKCTAAELRDFIEARTSATLSKKERRTIQNCNKYQLANRLVTLDLASTFPRFMELPAEIRLSVYELLLVDTRGRDSSGFVTNWNRRYRLHTAVLRASKWIHSEAQPVLYKKNKFEAAIEASEVRLKTRCEMRIILPGANSPYHQRMLSSPESSFLGEMFEDPVMGALRCLTHMTINLSLVTEDDRESNKYVPRARDAIACLCLSLTGASKVKELTINIDLRHPRARNKIDLARILWPLVFLRTDIVVKFEGIAELSKTSTADLRRVPHATAHYGRHIAKVRQLCNKQIESRGSDLVGVRGVEDAFARMCYFGEQFIFLDDTVDLSAAWTGMRNEADRVEAMGLEEESLL
jgi:hypothetical protein